MVVTTLSDFGEWQELAERCEYATFFHTPDWYKIFAQGNLPAVIHANKITFSNGTIAILPVLETRVSATEKLYFSGPAGVYGGWIAAAPLSVDRQQEMVRLLLNEFKPLIWRLNPFAPERENLKLGKVRADFTQVLDLGFGFESILKKWSKGHYAAMRQAQRLGVTVSRARKAKDWQDYFGCYQDSLERWGEKASSRYEWSLFEQLSLLPPEKCSLWLARSQGSVIAGALCFTHHRHIAYWHGAAASDSIRLRPAHLLQYVAIQDACQRGCRWYDFNPSGSHAGVVKFKKGFGAEFRQADLVLRQRSRLRQTWLRLSRWVRPHA